MASMQNILVKDDKGTEVTLIPVSDNPAAVWRSNIANVPIMGQMQLTISVDKLKSGDYKITSKLEVPVMEVISESGNSGGYVSAPKVAYVNTAIFTMFANGRSDSESRANLLKMAVGVVQGASATTATGVLNNTAAVDAWANSTLPGPLTYTNVIRPN